MHYSRSLGVKVQLGNLPRIKLAHLPTPLEEAPRLSDYLHGPRIWIKRDDLTGLALGGNKARKLEFLLGQARQQGCDVVITVGAVQSNHARMTAAAARRLGFEPIVVLNGEPPDQAQGNLLLDRIFGAEVRIIQTDDDYIVAGVVEDLARQLRRDGRKPFFIPRGGSNAPGAAGYLGGWLELLSPAHATRVPVDAGVPAPTPRGKQSSLYTGTKLTDSGVQGIGVSAGPRREGGATRGLGVGGELG